MTDEAKRPIPKITERAFLASTKAAGLGPESALTVQLGRRMAQLIDAARDTSAEAKTLTMLGGELQRLMEKLGINPGTRPAGDVPDVPDVPAPLPVSRTDELRRRRAQRAAGA